MNPDTVVQERLFLGAHMDEPETLEVGPGRASVLTRGCPGGHSPDPSTGADVPSANEDGAAVFQLGPDHVVLAVADGVGGARGGAQATAEALQCLSESLRRVGSDADRAREAILTGIEEANALISSRNTGAGTTLALAELWQNQVRTYHVGDTLVMGTDSLGGLRFQTVAHSPVGFAFEHGLLDEREAMHHEERHLIFNMVGSSEMRIEVSPPLPFEPNDTLLLASDGLFDNLWMDEILQRLRGEEPDHVARSLAELARRRMAESRGDDPHKPDDLTLLVWRNR